MNNDASPDPGSIGNRTISSLIDAQARVAWFRTRRVDSGPVAHALLDSPDRIGEEGS